MRRKLHRAVLWVGLLGLVIGWIGRATAEESRWEPRIRAFEALDAEKMPPEGGIVFIGSSSIVGWDVEQSFPDLPVVNRGFGGSQIADSVLFAPRILLPYKPKTVVFYAGDNDIAAGKTPERVLADFREFVGVVHSALPNTRIVFIAIKPCMKRWALVDEVRKANRLVREVVATDERLVFVDIDAPSLGEDGKPRRELFKADQLHLNAEGYRLWTSLVRPHLLDTSETP
ncbi:MAG: SGNH/GDSL hydrolase family protein [Patescibacteria group bacterium]|nr:SGNH/GDSL hydrolase family protein [Patescibacteria group bacterium]